MLEALHRLAAHLHEQVSALGTSPFARAQVPNARVRAFRACLQNAEDAPPAAGTAAPAGAPQNSAAAPFQMAAASLAGPPPPTRWSLLRAAPMSHRGAARLAPHSRAG